MTRLELAAQRESATCPTGKDRSEQCSNNEAAQLHANRNGSRTGAFVRLRNTFGVAIQILDDGREIAIERHRIEDFLRVDGS